MKRRTAVIGSVAAGAMVLGGTAAYADIVGPDNTINACVANKTGALRIVGPDKPACAKVETALQWNQQGVPGVDGQDGADGLPGLKGEEGDPGPLGTVYTIDQHLVFSGPDFWQVQASCDPGDLGLDSDIQIHGNPTDFINERFTVGDRTTFRLHVFDTDGTVHPLYALALRAVCMDTAAPFNH